MDLSRIHKNLCKWPSAVTRLTAHFTCGMMSDLVICKHRNEYKLKLLKPRAGRPGLPPIKCIGRSNNNTAANSGLWTLGFKIYHYQYTCIIEIHTEKKSKHQSSTFIIFVVKLFFIYKNVSKQFCVKVGQS